jgi:hypothetical protein
MMIITLNKHGFYGRENMRIWRQGISNIFLNFNKKQSTFGSVCCVGRSDNGNGNLYSLRWTIFVKMELPAESDWV